MNRVCRYSMHLLYSLRFLARRSLSIVAFLLIFDCLLMGPVPLFFVLHFHAVPAWHQRERERVHQMMRNGGSCYPLVNINMKEERLRSSAAPLLKSILQKLTSAIRIIFSAQRCNDEKIIVLPRRISKRAQIYI